MSYIVSIIVIFIVLSAAYSFISDKSESVPEIPISQLSADIKSGIVTSITVRGDSLDLIYRNDSTGVASTTPITKTSKKEPGEALSQTLINYGVTKEELSSVKIDIKNENGFGYWLINLLPIIFPILFILVFIWFITRQVKGAGMQALTFGQSKARMIDPNDKTQRVTFKDVAGCKEAKEELFEIVDFLKNPRKFQKVLLLLPCNLRHL